MTDHGRHITIDRVENILDYLANAVVRRPNDARKILLIYKRLEDEVDAMRSAATEHDELLTSVLRRVRRSSGQKAALSA